MNKADAIARAGGSERLDVRYTQFSNINVAKDVWWIEISRSRLKSSSIEKIDLLLFDGSTDELHHLVVPTSFVRDHLSQLTIRADNDRIQLELKARGPNRFRNVKPISSQVDFAQFVARTT